MQFYGKSTYRMFNKPEKIVLFKIFSFLFFDLINQIQEIAAFPGKEKIFIMSVFICPRKMLKIAKNKLQYR